MLIKWEVISAAFDPVMESLRKFMNTLIIINVFFVGSFAIANSSNFCSTQSIAAVKGLATVNGSAANNSIAFSNVGFTYTVILSDNKIRSDDDGSLIEEDGQDFYTVECSPRPGLPCY